MPRPSAPVGELGSLSVSEHPENPTARRFRARGRMRLPDFDRRDPETGAYAAGARVDVTGWGRTAGRAQSDCRRAAADRLVAERQRVETAARAVAVGRQVGHVADVLLRSAESSGELAPSSVAAYRQALRNLLVTDILTMDIGAVRPSDVTTALTFVAAQAAENQRSDRNGTGAAKTARSLLNRVFGHAVALGWVDRSPVKDAPALRVPRVRSERNEGDRVPIDHDRALTRSERVHLAWSVVRSERAKRLDTRDFVLAGLAIGCRIGELTALRWCDVTILRHHDSDGRRVLTATVSLDGTVDRETGKGLVRHRPKTESSVRTIPVPRRIAALLVRRARAAGLTESELADSQVPVFPNPGRWGTGQGFRDRSNTTKSLRVEFDAAGYPWLAFHGLRRAAVTALADHLPIRAVADYAGHSSIRTTMDSYIGRSAVSADVAKYL